MTISRFRKALDWHPATTRDRGLTAVIGGSLFGLVLWLDYKIAPESTRD